MTFLVRLVDGHEVDVAAQDRDDAVLAAGSALGQDVAHLVLEVIEQ